MSWSLARNAVGRRLTARDGCGHRLLAAKTPKPQPIAAPRRHVGAYDNDGKTYASMLNNNNIGDGIMISGYTQYGFRLNNGFMVLGPVVCFANTIMAWYVDDERDVSEAALSLLLHVEPAPAVVVLGVGDQAHRRHVDRAVLAAARRHRCTVEVLPVDAAVATYNFVVAEGRHAAGAFIPPRFIPAVDDDVITASARHVHLYGDELPREDVWRDDQEHEERVNANYREFSEVVGAQNAAEAERRSRLPPPGGRKDRPPKKID